jgi:membrane protein required for colicin V production
VTVLVVGGLCNFLLGKLVSSTGLSGTDRLLGALFGLLRGGAIVLAAVIVARFTPFPNDPWWQGSQLLPQFERTAVWAVRQFPESLQSQIPDSAPTLDEAEAPALGRPAMTDSTSELPEETRAEP